VRVLALLCLAMGVMLVACSANAVPTDTAGGFAGISTSDARDLPLNVESREEGRQGTNGGTVFDPISAPIDDEVAYRFDLGHCGLLSPVDLDGSFWDPLDGVTSSGAQLDLAGDPEMINAAAGAIVVIGDEMRFRTALGSVVRFERHEGEKEFPGCD
jgi:hypothetical protein